MQGETIWSQPANSGSVGLFLFAKGVSGNKFDLAGAGDQTLGVFIDVAGSGNYCSVQLDRVAKITLAATLHDGDPVQSDGSGKAVAFTSGKYAGTLLADGVSGDIVPIKLA
jgi:hypothetical protein